MRIIILFLFFISFQSSAYSLKVNSLQKFDIVSEQKSIRFNSGKRNIKFKKIKCNEVIFSTAEERLRLIKSGPALHKGEVPDKFNFKIDGIPYHEEIGSYRAKYLLGLPGEMERLKLEESFRCKK